MKVIIDTNVLVSAILKDKKPEAVILFIAERPDVEWIASSKILAEYKEVIGREKFALPEGIKERWFEMLDALVTVVDVDLSIDFPRDQKDSIFLACAVVAGTNYFITGDGDFEHAEKLAETTILSVSQFKKLVCDVLDER